jgi:hypothetical protein
LFRKEGMTMATNLISVTESKSVWERVKDFGLRLLDHMYVGEFIN